jgi:hypothetical protein
MLHSHTVFNVNLVTLTLEKTASEQRCSYKNIDLHPLIEVGVLASSIAFAKAAMYLIFGGR